ncbi:MAG: cysteine hydrolase [Gemmatimonadota bacterium]|nr:cysteine hydrolase [Gemmatimonadota bacterium]
MSKPLHASFELPRDATLVVVDVQQAFNDPKWGQRNNPDAESRVRDVITAWRATDRPIIHIQHVNPKHGSLFNPDSPGVRFKPEAEPLDGEPILTKDVNSAFIGTDLEARLRAAGANVVVFVGMITDHCVSTTTRMAGNLGFEAYVVSDATATFERIGPDGTHFTAEQMHDTALASLNGEFATVVSTDDLIGALK